MLVHLCRLGPSTLHPAFFGKGGNISSSGTWLDAVHADRRVGCLARGLDGGIGDWRNVRVERAGLLEGQPLSDLGMLVAGFVSRSFGLVEV
jgi:hypothetical protein